MRRQVAQGSKYGLNSRRIDTSFSEGCIKLLSFGAVHSTRVGGYVEGSLHTYIHTCIRDQYSLVIEGCSLIHLVISSYHEIAAALQFACTDES